jgi:hypothetical protein
MWHHLVKTFFIGQVACEQAVEAIKKQGETVFEKKDEFKDALKHKVEELKTEKLFDKSKFEGRLKKDVAGLRKGFQSFDQACHSLNELLVETAEIKETLIHNEAQTKELVST